MTIAAVLVASPGSDLAEDVSLIVIDHAALNAGDPLLIRFTIGGASRSGRVIRMEDHGLCPVIEVEGKRWWLRRRATVDAEAVLPATGPAPAIPFRTWTVGGPEL